MCCTCAGLARAVLWAMRKFLLEKEQVEIRCRPHSRILLWPISVGLLAIMVGSAALAKLQPDTFYAWAPGASQWRDVLVLSVVALVTLVLLAYPIRRVWRWAGTIYTLTNQRLLVRRGLVSRRLQILDLAQIHQMQPVQNWRQRMVGSGDLQLFFHSDIHSDKVVTVNEIPYWSEFNQDAQQFWAKEFRAYMQQTLRESDYAGVVGMSEKELRKLGRDH